MARWTSAGTLDLPEKGKDPLPARRKSMRKIKEVLRLFHEVGLGQREIARCAQLAQSAVHEYLERAGAAGLSWPLPEGLDDQAIEDRLFPTTQSTEGRYPLPDYQHIDEELRTHSNLTLQLLWEEYRRAHAYGCCYSRYCVLYRRWKKKQALTLRQQHKPGEKLFLDWAGATIPIHDRQSGAITPAPLFVAVLGASSYAYAEVTSDQRLPNWMGAQVRTFEYLGGCPKRLVPDNTKTGVIRACRYDPDLNPTYQDMAMHYGIGVLPARPYKPRDKAKVESGVQVVQRWIVAALRHRKFFSVAEAHQAVWELLEKLNARPFKKRAGSRASLFAELDRPALQPLPATAYAMSEWVWARVNIDYHIAFDDSFYSVPYTLVQQKVEVRATANVVEIFHKGQRVASHRRSYQHERAVTQDEHRPHRHRAHLEWTPSRMVNWAATIGTNTAQLFERILADKPHPEMGYRSGLGLIRLAKHYSNQRLEAAAERAVRTGACRYISVKSILERGLDQQPPADSPPLSPPPTEHENLRGASYFDSMEEHHA
jgi:transposase